MDKTTLRYLSKHHLLCLQLYLGKSNDVNRIEQTFYCHKNSRNGGSCSLCIFLFVCSGDSIYSSETVVRYRRRQDSEHVLFKMSELKIGVSSSSVPAYVNLTASNWSSQPITVAPGLSCTPSVFLNCVPDHICLTAASTPQRTTAGQSLRLSDAFINPCCVFC